MSEQNKEPVPSYEQDHGMNGANSDHAATPVGSGGYPVPPAMNASNYPVYVPYKRKEQDEILEQTSSRKAFLAVIFFWLFGIAFSEIFLKGGFGLSVPLLMSVFYILSFWYLSGKEKKPSRPSLLLLIPIGILSLGFFLHENEMTYFINILLLMVLIPLQLCLMSNTTAGPAFSAQSIFDTLVSFVARPLGYLDTPFKALAHNAGHKNKNSQSSMVFLGLLIALPVALIFIGLFSQADSAFSYFFNQISEKINVSFGGVIFDLFFGTIAALFISSWLITMRARKTPEKKKFQSINHLNGTLTATVLFVINLVMITFVVIQFEYLFARAALPGNMNYADYARSGFFELCGVLCFSVLIILLCILLVERKEKQTMPSAVSVLLTVFIACNYVIIASAVYRMFAYIGAYDLSVKRVMVTWLIVVFALCMIGALIKIWRPGFHTFNYVALVVIVMTSAVNLMNVNSFVANYNVDSYIHSLSTDQVRDIDVPYLGSLGSSAVDATFKLYNSGNTKIKSDSILALRMQKEHLDRKDWKNSCITDFNAEQKLSDIH